MKNTNLLILSQSIQKHIKSKNIQRITTSQHIQINPKSFITIPQPQIALKQTLITISIKPKSPFLNQPNTPIQITKKTNQNINRRNRSLHTAFLHIIKQRLCLFESKRGRGAREGKEKTVIDERIVFEGGAKVEEFESKGRVFEGFENEGSFERGEGDGEGLEIVGEVGEGVGESGGGGGGEEDLGGFADEVTAGEIVAERVGGEGWWWSYFGGEGTAGGGG